MWGGEARAGPPLAAHELRCGERWRRGDHLGEYLCGRDRAGNVDSKPAWVPNSSTFWILATKAVSQSQAPRLQGRDEDIEDFPRGGGGQVNPT
jgi:hypothetical protein